jgi:uncharacterized membrane protein
MTEPASQPASEPESPRLAEPPGQPPELPSTARENIERLADFADREEAKVTGIRLWIERISSLCGSPSYFIFVIAFIVLWVLVNTWGAHAGWRHFDEPPFFWLQGIVSSNALLLTVAVLIRQNRMAQLAEHRAHLDLQINLLAEQKVTKILQIIDELRRDSTAPRDKP